MNDELKIGFPAEWLDEYKDYRLVKEWCRAYPKMFEHALYGRGSPVNRGFLSDNPGTLDLFPQYALQYLLKKHQGIESLTWFKISIAKPTCYIDKCWNQMRELMGRDFDVLRQTLRAAGFKGFTGEPDLFCWDPGKNWFFAEAKSTDRLLPTQKKWMKVYHEVLPMGPEIRVYRLLADFKE